MKIQNMCFVSHKQTGSYSDGDTEGDVDGDGDVDVNGEDYS